VVSRAAGPSDTQRLRLRYTSLRPLMNVDGGRRVIVAADPDTGSYAARPVYGPTAAVVQMPQLPTVNQDGGDW
jgi:hypothetical protein